MRIEVLAGHGRLDQRVVVERDDRVTAVVQDAHQLAEPSRRGIGEGDGLLFVEGDDDGLKKPGELRLVLSVLDFGQMRLRFSQKREMCLEGVLIREGRRGRGVSTGEDLEGAASQLVGQREVLVYGMGEPRPENEDVARIVGMFLVHAGDRRAHASLQLGRRSGSVLNQCVTAS